MVDKEFVTDKMDLKWNTQRIYLLKLLLNEIIVKKKNVNIFKMENWWRERRNLFCKHTQTSKLHSVLIVRLDRVYFSVYISVLYVTNQKGMER